MSATRGFAIIGATGYLGRTLAEQAASAGYEVTATYWAHPPRPLPVRWEQLDVRDARAIGSLLAATAPDVVVNCAYVQSGPDLRRITTDAAEALARHAAHLVHISSDVIFAGRPDRPYRETDNPDPVHPYGHAKADAERAVLAQQPDALVVRTSLIYGGRDPGPQEVLVERALAGEAMSFFTDEIRCPVQVDDLARAILELVALHRTGIVNVAGSDAVSRFEFAQLLAGARRDGIRGAPQAAETRRPSSVALDLGLATSLLGPSAPRGVRTVLTSSAPRPLNKPRPRSDRD